MHHCLFFRGHVLMAVLVAILGIISCDETMLTFGAAVLFDAAQFGDWWHTFLIALLLVIAYKIEGL